MEYLDKQSAKKIVYETNVSLHQKKLAIQSFGNTSNRIKDGFIIKPSGVDLNKVKTEKMVEVSSSGSFNESGLKPSIDEPTHRVIYQNFKEIGGIVHTHSKFATSFAQAGKSIKNYGTTHSDYSEIEILCTRSLKEKEIENNYEYNTGVLIVETLNKLRISPLWTPGILVKHHGLFSWGVDAYEAVKNAEAIEYIAEMAFYSEALNENIKKVPNALSSKHIKRKIGIDSYYGQDSEV